MTKSTRAFILCVVFLALASCALLAQETPGALDMSGPVYVSPPVVPTITPAVRDLPDFNPDPNLFGPEAKRREDYGFIPIEYPVEPKTDSLLQLQKLEGAPQPDAFSTLIHNYAGQSSTSSPPDTTGDVGPTYYLQATNQSVSSVRVINKSTGANTKTFAIDTLATASPCTSGFCDPIVLYDRTADRWIVSELPSSTGDVCVYVSTTNDPTGTYYAYTFAVESSTDYPKYGVWPQNGNAGSYLVGLNASSTSGKWDLCAFDRAKMLAGQPATFQRFSVTGLANSGFQLVLPVHMQGSTPPPDGEPAVFARPHDDEAEDGANTPSYDLLDLWTLSVNWTTPASSVLTTLTPLHIADYDMTLCGMGSTWNCMPQPGTTQKIDPIREPLHWPLQYRNFGDHQTLVGCFVEDVDGTDHAALRWFEVRKTGAGAWSLYQEGVVGGEAGVHRSVGSIAMDGSGNMAIGYTRTGSSTPYYPSIYYKGRLSTDTLGTMPQGEYSIQDGAYSKTGDERWGDYAGMAIDPSDDCTFWFTTEYMTSSSNCGTRVAAFKFDQCGCASIPAAPVASATVPAPPPTNRIDVGWNDSATASITQYLVSRSTVSGGPYTQIAAVNDTSPGVGNGAPYTYHDDTVSGGTRYYYIVKSTDGVSCTSAASNEVNALATGTCLLPPTFAGITSVTNPGNTTCTLSLAWSAGTSNCAGTVTYNVYRSTTAPFTPGAGNRIASGVSALGYTDTDNLISLTAYYYIVRAVDSANAQEDTNTVTMSGAPTGPITTSNLADTFEGALSGGGFDLAGWTHSAINGTTNWAWSTAQHHDGTHSWYAQDIATVSDMVLVSPSFGVGAPTTLSFYHTYAFESGYDGGTLEYTTNGGTTWTMIPTADFTAGAYSTTISTSYSNPIGGMTAWTGGTVGTMTLVSVNLGGDSNMLNKTVQIRWHEGNDSSQASTGWYVDSVAINNAQVMGTCTTSTGCTAPGAPTLISATGDYNGVNLSWTAGTGSTASYNVYRSTNTVCPVGTLTKIAGPITATTYADTSAVAGATYTYVVRGACDAGGTTESVNSNCLAGARLTSPNIVYQSHGTFAQVTGDGDAYYDRGEKWSVSVTLTNNGTAAATNVTATLGGNGITVCTPTKSFGSIGVGGTGSATFDFVIDSGFTPCGGAINFNVTSKSCTELTPAGADENGVFNIANVGKPTAGSPTELVIQPSTYDTYVNQNSSGTNYGTATTMLTNVRTSQEADCLVQFDLSGIPAGATINSATLELYNTTAPASSYAVDVMRNTATWNETAVTWTTKPAYNATYVAQITPTTAIGWKIWTVTSAVQGWYGGSYTNYGFTVKPDTQSGNTNVRYTFATRENATTGNRPILRVNYTPATGGWDCTYVGSGTCATCTPPSAPVINSITDVDPCVQNGIQVNYTAGTPATRHDLYKDSSLAVTGYTSGATYAPGDTSSHSYVVRAVNSLDTCYTDSASQSGTDALCSAPSETSPGTGGSSTGMSWSDKDTIGWQVVSGIVSGYRLYKGVPTDLPNVVTASDDSCTRYDGPSLSYALQTSDQPASGSFYWFLVTAYNGAGEGSAGNASSGPRTINSTGSCP